MNMKLLNRNRLSHFHHRLNAAEILEILKTGLEDFEEFGRHIRTILLSADNPRKLICSGKE